MEKLLEVTRATAPLRGSAAGFTTSTQEREVMKIQEFDLAATWKTARARKTPSKPLLWLLEHGHLTHQQMILDWGCGKAKDVDFLANQLAGQWPESD